jgi:hypothetical protein
MVHWPAGHLGNGVLAIEGAQDVVPSDVASAYWQPGLRRRGHVSHEVRPDVRRITLPEIAEDALTYLAPLARARGEPGRAVRPVMVEILGVGRAGHDARRRARPGHR